MTISRLPNPTCWHCSTVRGSHARHSGSARTSSTIIIPNRPTFSSVDSTGRATARAALT